MCMRVSVVVDLCVWLAEAVLDARHKWDRSNVRLSNLDPKELNKLLRPAAQPEKKVEKGAHSTRAGSNAR